MMKSVIVFTDGHTEDITFYVERPDHIEFHTETDVYQIEYTVSELEPGCESPRKPPLLKRNFVGFQKYSEYHKRYMYIYDIDHIELGPDACLSSKIQKTYNKKGENENG